MCNNLQCNYLIPSMCCILILKGFDIPAYVSSMNFPAVISLFLFYGYVWGILLCIYFTINLIQTTTVGSLVECPPNEWEVMGSNPG